MGVNYAKFIGYTIDILDDLNDLDSLVLDELLYNLKPDNKYGLKSYYDGFNKDDVIIIYDGMSGEYAKLIYIVDYDLKSYEDECKFVNSVNSLLSTSEVPSKIRIKLIEIYSKIFGSIKSKEVKAEYVMHWS